MGICFFSHSYAQGGQASFLQQLNNGQNRRPTAVFNQPLLSATHLAGM